MSSKQALMQEIDALPPDSIDEVSTFVSFLKFRSKTSSSSDVSLNEFDNLIKMIHAATDEPMPPIESIKFRGAEV